MKVRISTYDANRAWDEFQDVMEVEVRDANPSIWQGHGSDIDIVTGLEVTWRTEPFSTTEKWVKLIIEGEVKK